MQLLLKTYLQNGTCNVVFTYIGYRSTEIKQIFILFYNNMNVLY